MTSIRPGDGDLDRRVAAAYDDVLREPVPDRLANLLATPAPAAVTNLAVERSRRRGNWSWAQWGGMAASLALGVFVGWQFDASRGGGDALLAEAGGKVVAGPALSQALDERLASDSAARVAVQLSFLDKSGQYCRTFSADSVAGLACRDNGRWNVVATAQAPAANATAMRQASSSLPKAVLDAVDARIAGHSLDAAQERAARDHGWKK